MLDFSSINNRTLLGRALRLPLAFIPRNAVVPILGGAIKGTKWRIGSSTHGCWLGSYEKKKQLAIARWLQQGAVAYDIGANVGFYTLLFAKAVGPEGRVFAFEPSPVNVTDLLRHLRINELRNCRVVSAALGRDVALGCFDFGSSHSMGRLSHSDTTLHVPTLSLDWLIGRGGIPAPTILKLDVEGAEAEVLSGASSLLQARNAAWFVALHGEEATRQCARIFRSLGYQIFDLDNRELTDKIATDEIYAVHPKRQRMS